MKKPKTLIDCAFGPGDHGEVRKLVNDIEASLAFGDTPPDELWIALGKVMFRRRDLRISEALEKSNPPYCHDILGARVIVIYSKLCDVLNDCVGKPRNKKKPLKRPTISQWVKELGKRKIVGEGGHTVPTDRYARSLAQKYGLKLGSSPRGKPSHLDR